jgi:hypothetical protein
MTDATPTPPDVPTPPVTPPPAYSAPAYSAPESAPYAAPGANGYTAPYAGAPVAKTNTLAIVAIILGFVVPIGGIITGHIALSQIKKTGEQGHGLALAGTILGYVFTAIGIVYLIFVIGLFFAAGVSGGFNSGFSDGY